MKKLITCIVDYSIYANNKPVIYEIQQFVNISAPSELSNFSRRKRQKNEIKVLKKLGITPPYFQYKIVSSLNKGMQREALLEGGCQDLQPRFMRLDQSKLLEHDPQEIIDFVMSCNNESFIVKDYHGTRGEGNFFITKDELIEKLTAQLLGDTVSERLGFASKGVVLEEYINPQFQETKGETFRACLAFDPDDPENIKATMLCIDHHSELSSHSYKINGETQDFVDGIHYIFRDRKIVETRNAKEPPEISPETKGHFLRAMQAISSEAVRCKQELVTEIIGNRDKRLTAFVVHKYCEIIVDFLSENSAAIKNLTDAETLKNIRDDIMKLMSEIDQSMRYDALKQKKSPQKLKQDLIKILGHRILPIFYNENIEILDHKYPLKKLLALTMIGDIDRNSASAEEKLSHKLEIDKFILTPLKKEVIDHFLQKTLPDILEIKTLEKPKPSPIKHVKKNTKRPEWRGNNGLPIFEERKSESYGGDVLDRKPLANPKINISTKPTTTPKTNFKTQKQPAIKLQQQITTTRGKTANFP